TGAGWSPARRAVRAGHGQEPALSGRLGLPLAWSAFRRRRCSDDCQSGRRGHLPFSLQLPAGGNLVRAFLKPCETPMVWLLFFVTSVYGHVALKVAVDRSAQDEAGRMFSALRGVWGWSACLAWGMSCLLWMLALSRHRLVFANGLSSLRYVLVGA